jgi:hypothetical protein
LKRLLADDGGDDDPSLSHSGKQHRGTALIQIHRQEGSSDVKIVIKIDFAVGQPSHRSPLLPVADDSAFRYYAATMDRLFSVRPRSKSRLMACSAALDYF